MTRRSIDIYRIFQPQLCWIPVGVTFLIIVLGVGILGVGYCIFVAQVSGT